MTFPTKLIFPTLFVGNIYNHNFYNQGIFRQKPTQIVVLSEYSEIKNVENLQFSYKITPHLSFCRKINSHAPNNPQLFRQNNTQP